MDIKRNGQTITFDTNPDQTQDADLVQTSDYLNSAGLPVPVQNMLIKGRRVVASTGFLARQAMRELAATTSAETLGELMAAVDDLLDNTLNQGYYEDNLRAAIASYRKSLLSPAPADVDAAPKTDDDSYTPPRTYHPGRCYCGQFAPGHTPGLTPRYGTACTGDTGVAHDASTCGACIAGATDYRPTIEVGQTWISVHGTDHEVSGPGDEEGTWAMWGPTGHLYVTTEARLHTAYTLDLDR